jgi:hypothetical protein
MIELTVCNYLNEKLDCPVLPEKPDRPFGRMVFVERTGGRGRFLRETTLAVQSYGTSLYEAAALNEEVIEQMMGLVEVSEVTKVTLNSNYNYTDTTTKEYRYQAVFDIVHY